MVFVVTAAPARSTALAFIIRRNSVTVLVYFRISAISSSLKVGPSADGSVDGSPEQPPLTRKASAITEVLNKGKLIRRSVRIKRRSPLTHGF